MKVPILDLYAQYDGIMDEIKAEIQKVYDIHYYILGPAVKNFEAEMATFLGVKHAIGCASGTDALLLAITALGIKEGDEIITTPFTFFATAGSIARCGAVPVFVDICPDTFNLDPAKIATKITPKTKAILPVHLYGQAANMDEIMKIANEHKLAVIEDNAQGVGAKWNGKCTGTFGDIGTLSFFPSKNLGAMGDAGMCLTNDDALADKLRQLRMHGENPRYFHKWVGFNSRIDSMQAAVLSVKLRYLSGWSEARRANATYYRTGLAAVSQVTLPYIHPQAETIYNQFTLLAEDRDGLLAHLQANNVGCAIYYPLSLHLQECFNYLGGGAGDYPVSESVSKKAISIPIFSELSNEQKDYVIAKIKEFYQ